MNPNPNPNPNPKPKPKPKPNPNQVPAYGVDLGVKLTHLDLGAISMRRRRTNSDVSAYTSHESRVSYDKVRVRVRVRVRARV